MVPTHFKHGFAHRGIVLSSQVLARLIKPVIQPTVDSLLLSAEDSPIESVHIVVTGHSLGAAVASLVAVDLTDFYRDDPQYHNKVHVSGVGFATPAMVSKVSW